MNFMKNLLIGHKNKKVSETFLLTSVLAIIGGFVDAYTFFTRGKVLANAQTGNIVFLSLNLVELNFRKVFSYLLPISAFMLGILISEFIKHNAKKSKIHWKQVVILLEIVILIISAFIPQGKYDIYVNVMISFFCSLQVQTFRFTKEYVVATTMCTGNLRSGTEQLFQYFKTGRRKYKESFIIYYGLIIAFMIGAILGSFFSEILLEKATLVAAIILFGLFYLLSKEEK